MRPPGWLIPSRPARLAWWLGLCLLTAALPACSFGIGVRKANSTPLLAAWKASFTDADDLSPRTLQTLRQLDLANLYHRHPEDAYGRLHGIALDDPQQPDLLFALAEICFHLGRDAEKRAGCAAVTWYYLCAGYAYHFLFPTCEHASDEAHPLPATSRDAFDPRFRLACDLYNNSLGKCIRAAQRIGRLDPRHYLHLPGTHGDDGFTLSVVQQGFPWRPDEFGPLLFCSDYEAVGLDNHFHTYGLGVPLIGIREAAENAAPGHAFYPREVSFPVTAFFRFPGTLADLGACRAGRLELYNPLTVQSIAVGRKKVPLETDLTTPLAYFLSKTDLEGVEVSGFLRADSLRHRQGIYLFEPYQPGKIPVLMVHGIFSSPLTWTPLFNELRADPELRKHYQFWFYLYPTGDPYVATAADLRQALEHLRADLDPQHRDAALDQMVFVGHSMGGLVSKLTTQASGNDFWGLVSKEPFQQVKAQPEARAELQRIFFFEQEPCIRRVVFLGTPHHGSKLSPSPPARLLAKFIRLPHDLMDAARDVARENPGLWSSLGSGSAPNIPTSLDLLSPGAPALELLAARPAPPGVHYHSIIGAAFGHGENASDGVVSYHSAHIDGVDSELIIPAMHQTVHHHPRAVLEVRRILQEHLRAVKGEGKGQIQQAGCR